MARRATLKDVAQAAGVSVTTVSLVLNGRPARVSMEKRELIAKAAKELHYVPNQSARSLVTKQSKLVALIVPDIENLFFAALSKCVEDECAAQGYSLIVANSDDSRTVEHDLMVRLSSRGVDGMMLIPARESCAAEDKLQADVEQVACPVVLIDRLVQNGWCDAVGFDNYVGGQLAARYLLEEGHRHIGIVTGDVAESSAFDRKRGFMDAVEQAGEHFDPALCVAGDYRFDSGYQAADRIVDGGATAVFCCNDVMALGFRQRLAERGLQVPQDMRVIGYDNILNRFGLGMHMTTVEQSVAELAAACWRMLSTRIDVAISRTGAGKSEDDSESEDAQGGERPWLSRPRVQVLTPRLVQAVRA
ncbi:LacI family DNA-binding transcriptional regulator [Bifidobacterium moukalabense]|uniref:LacI family DNA-binding transcriptional regulator n=1 Tax=Bifidobacterium moukalabense TaxID=1333651 RepID=UPI0010F55BB8|nr:LacI family DNA-binding transcriptional regulator [Bifidobacterium moukalabense]